MEWTPPHTLALKALDSEDVDRARPWLSPSHQLPPVFIISKLDEGTRQGPRLGEHIMDLLGESVPTRITVARYRFGDDQELFWSYGSGPQCPFAITGSMANDGNESVPDYIHIPADLTIELELSGLDLGVRKYNYKNRARVTSRAFSQLKEDEPLLGLSSAWRIGHSHANVYTAENFVDLRRQGRVYEACCGLRTITIRFIVTIWSKMSLSRNLLMPMLRAPHVAGVATSAVARSSLGPTRHSLLVPDSNLSSSPKLQVSEDGSTHCESLGEYPEFSVPAYAPPTTAPAPTQWHWEGAIHRRSGPSV